jgi:glycogen phosphorylase
MPPIRLALPLEELDLLSGRRPVRNSQERGRHAADVAEHVVYLHDYDLGMAARLVRGCDLWLNLPRPPFEASGTSGMKAVINGGLNLSTLDGWWAEAYDGTNGWALSGEVDPDSGAQDARDAAALFGLLEGEVLPAFYDRDADGLPRSWLERIRASMRTLAPAFCAGRMLEDYLDRIYTPTRPSA